MEKGSRWGYKKIKRSQGGSKSGDDLKCLEKKRQHGDEVDMDVDSEERVSKVGKTGGVGVDENTKKAGPTDRSCEA